MARRRRHLGINEPLRHADHARPVTRREFIRQGFMTGAGMTMGGGVFSLFSNPRDAYAAVSADLDALAADINDCSLGGLTGAKKIPFICFDLAGGANLAGSNVLVGQAGGQMDVLSTAGYSKLGLPGDMVPGLLQTNFLGTLLNTSATNDFVNSQLGLKFHADSPMLAGILEKARSVLAKGEVNGCVIPARSDNDTGNNPHNPMYAIAEAGGNGGVVSLIGSRSSDSGGNSMSPSTFMNASIRPTKVDRPSDVTGMVDVGNLTGILNDPVDVTAVMESMARLSHKKMAKVNTNISGDAVIKDLVRCGYLKAADIAERFAGREVSPDDRDSSTPMIVANDVDFDPDDHIFSATEFDRDGEFRKTASVMKMVIDGHAGAGCITMGGYDYHTGDRQTGENRDLRAGRCIGACLEYAAKNDQPVMIYVYSDGSLASNGNIDNSQAAGNNELGGRGKGQWTGDNSSTACSFFLVYNPTGVIQIYNNDPAELRQQIGRFSADGSVVTSSSPAANNVNLLVNTVMLNYMALHGEEASFAGKFTNGNHGLGNIDDSIAFGQIIP
ncbi:MAG: general secretion pathway protein GspF [Gammaproteobacteria bacterium]|nr:general secretion pathway protein GspF [Gammaproteobacteria bacterium]MCW8909359.1 general secretion pathway protein GspF [Gammaproteobacteria bacterium]MCW9003613.1 general secretion pathway protein GspF [Gammaproteobacteria bacterium]MCW9055879.1 general secretion pathway protein GspF [Gammaproteobacteria bacterium]